MIVYRATRVYAYTYTYMYILYTTLYRGNVRSCALTATGISGARAGALFLACLTVTWSSSYWLPVHGVVNGYAQRQDPGWHAVNDDNDGVFMTPLCCWTCRTVYRPRWKTERKGKKLEIYVHVCMCDSSTELVLRYNNVVFFLYARPPTIRDVTFPILPCIFFSPVAINGTYSEIS